MFSKIPNNANIAKNQARAESMGVSQNFRDPGLITEVCNFEISMKKCIFFFKNLDRTVSAFHFFRHIGQQFSRLGRPVV